LRAFSFSTALVLLAGAHTVPAVSAAELDGWCSTATKPSSIVICSDSDLRHMAVERTKLFNAAKDNLTPEAYQSLLDDQSRWIKSYTSACGVPVDGSTPALPISRTVIDCYKRAGRDRITFLTSYVNGRMAAYPTATVPGPGVSQASAVPAATPPPFPSPASAAAEPASPLNALGPSFDCTTTVRPLGKLICARPELAKADLRFKQAYQALQQQLGDSGQAELRQEAADFDKGVRLDCGVPEKEPVAGSPDCVKEQYDEMRSEWLSRLSGSALQEANRPLPLHVTLQQNLLDLGYLSTSVKINGVFGTETRKAIAAWQQVRGLPETGFLGDSDARSLQQHVAERKQQQETREAENRKSQAREEAERQERDRQRQLQEREVQARDEAENKERDRQRQLAEVRRQAMAAIGKRIPSTDDHAILLVALGRDGGPVRRSLSGEFSLMDPSRRASACVLTDPTAAKPFIDAAVRRLMQTMVANTSTSITQCTGPSVASADLVLLYNIEASAAPSEMIAQLGTLLDNRRLQVAGTFSLSEWQAEVDSQRRHDEELARQQQELSVAIKKELLDNTFKDWGALALPSRTASQACVIALESDAWLGLLKANLPVSFRDTVQTVSINRDADRQLTRLLRGDCLLVFAHAKDLSEMLRGLIANNRPDAAILPMRIKQLVVDKALAQAAERQATREKGAAAADKVSQPAPDQAIRPSPPVAQNSVQQDKPDPPRASSVEPPTGAATSKAESPVPQQQQRQQMTQQQREMSFLAKNSLAQDTQRPCSDDKVRAAIERYFDDPSKLMDVAGRNQIILALLEPSPVSAETSRLKILGQRKIASADYVCLVEYEKILKYDNAVLYGQILNVTLTATVKAKFNLEWFGTSFTVSEQERLDSSLDISRENGGKLNAMGLNQKQEKLLQDKFKPMSPEGRAEFQKHPFGTAEENAKILREGVYGRSPR
jgi:uncharacterized protein